MYFFKSLEQPDAWMSLLLPSAPCWPAVTWHWPLPEPHPTTAKGWTSAKVCGRTRLRLACALAGRLLWEGPGTLAGVQFPARSLYPQRHQPWEVLEAEPSQHGAPGCRCQLLAVPGARSPTGRLATHRAGADPRPGLPCCRDPVPHRCRLQLSAHHRARL